MLEGLEVSEINLKDILLDNENKRIDSEYFRKQFLTFFKNVPNLRPLGSLVTDGYRVVYENTKVVDKEEAIKNNFPIFLQATDIETPFIKTKNLFYVSNSDWERYHKGRIKRGEILIEVKGKIDKVAIVPDDFPEKTLVTGSLFKLSVNNKISKNVLLTYLISKYGSAFKDRYKTNLLISFVSKPDLYRIPVPSFNKDIENRIDELFEKIFASKKLSQQKYAEAENLLLETVGFHCFQPSTEAVNVISFKESFLATGRLDAEYYQPKYEETINKIKQNDWSLLSYIVDISKSIEPGSSAYNEEKGLPFYRVSDYTKFGLSKPAKNLDDSYVKENKDLLDNLKPKEGTILFSKDGSVGTAYLLTENLNGVTSGATLHLKIKKEVNVLPEYLTLALNSKLVQLQAERDAGGSIILHWRLDEIENVVVPILDFVIQQRIATLIQESFALKAQSEHLLEVAKRAVEIAIEESEEVAVDYINKNS